MIRLDLENILRIQKISAQAIVPKRATPGSSGLDLFSSEFISISPNETLAVCTGWKMAVPLGLEIQIRPRSGLALKKQITIPNSPGTIDSDFRGEVKVILRNEGKESFIIEIGDKIAQMVVAPILICEPEVVESLDETLRGEGGFGSTGSK